MLIFIHTCSDTTNILYAKKNLKSLKATVNFELQKLFLWQVLIIKKQFVIMSVDYLPQPKFFDIGTNNNNWYPTFVNLIGTPGLAFLANHVPKICTYKNIMAINKVVSCPVCPFRFSTACQKDHLFKGSKGHSCW